ncbi:thermonuclease family protein [Sporolactobacillus spathodeae]|uniref:Endonuclease YncB(Thermonuclease family) n=1 Tax=Sporolactobacillus spathodeae TaxID=1465502 RepID=A0ABS2Q6Y4_9BACL|nr:thermonuclease family protein [Sporolactobacillus spathodeae]MBM7657080.1 endonuclease YncB(thermonuclease family) [Sporolactobacillus spathodeae]
MKQMKNIFALIGVITVAYLLLTSNGQIAGIDSKLTEAVTQIESSIGFSHQEANSESSGLVDAVVTRSSDGDTFHASVNGRNETIRILLIDTPEDQKPGTPVEPFSREAAAYAARVMPAGAHIKLQLGKAPDQRDHYGRLLAYVYEPDGTLYENDVVRRGLARIAYVYKPNTDHLTQLEQSQSYAESHHLKIWSIPGYVTSRGYNPSK